MDGVPEAKSKEARYNGEAHSNKIWDAVRREEMATKPTASSSHQRPSTATGSASSSANNTRPGLGEADQTTSREDRTAPNDRRARERDDKDPVLQKVIADSLKTSNLAVPDRDERK